jgi:aspartyl-tRNA(Asn)/glutamyl-tRNA(Gln) amidotransferase subunit A
VSGADIRAGVPAVVAEIHAGRRDPGEPAARADAAIRARNGALNAIPDYDPAVIAPQVERLRARLAAGERPPLAGLAATVKDHIPVAGWRVTDGSALFRDRVARADAPAVARLREAGAILVGRSNMSEFGCKGVTTNRVYGPTGHPLDPALTPGGSSGGAASAVAAGMCDLALASDGGGSVRRPAAHVGVPGFKPSTGAVAHPDGLSHTAVLGLMAREADVLRAAALVLRGPDPRDPVSVALPADGRDPRAARYAWTPTLGLDAAVDAEALAAAEGLAARARAAGLAIGPGAPRWPDGAGEAALMPLQHAALAARWEAEWRADPDVFDPDIAAQIEAGLALRGAEVAAAEAMSRAVAHAAAAFFAGDAGDGPGGGPDLLLSLTAPCAAWPHDRLAPGTIGGRPCGPRDHAALTPLVNHAFLPAATVPCGRDAAGLPFGLQIVGPRFADNLVLAAAELLAGLGDGA